MRNEARAKGITARILPEWSNNGAKGTYELLADLLLDHGLDDADAHRVLDAAFTAALQERDTARAKGRRTP